MEVSAPQEVIMQLNITIFDIYTPNQTDMRVTCPEGKQTKEKFKEFTIVTLNPGCRANNNSHVFASGIEVEETITVKQNNFNLHLKELVDMQGDQEKELLRIIKEKTLINEKPIDIVDITKIQF